MEVETEALQHDAACSTPGDAQSCIAQNLRVNLPFRRLNAGKHLFPGNLETIGDLPVQWLSKRLARCYFPWWASLVLFSNANSGILPHKPTYHQFSRTLKLTAPHLSLTLRYVSDGYRVRVSMLRFSGAEGVSGVERAGRRRRRRQGKKIIKRESDLEELRRSGCWRNPWCFFHANANIELAILDLDVYASISL